MRCWLWIALLCCFHAFCAPAQESIGFADPDDLVTLLAYRLPDWGYRVWDLGGSLSGNGRESTWDDTGFEIDFDSDLRAYRESEERTWTINAGLSGSFFRRDHDAPDDDLDEHSTRLATALSLGLEWRRYVNPTVSYVLATQMRTSFDELRREMGGDPSRDIARSFQGSVRAGFGLGRLRDVTPLLRAQRISERLRALGRKPLSRAQVLKLAEVLAKRGAYGTVFDRSDKQFWRDVFAPLAVEKPLTPYEVLYLADVLAEQIGERQEGFLATLSGEARRSTSEFWDATQVGPQLNVLWSRNLDLAHQISLRLFAGSQWEVDSPEDGPRATTFLESTHLWVLADRVLWENSLSGDLFYEENQRDDLVARRYQAGAASTLWFFIEDRITLRPQITWSYVKLNTDFGQESESWRWHASIRLAYALDSFLY